MYVVTNRNLQPNEPDERKFGLSFNETHPSNLRLAKVSKDQGEWNVEVLDDSIEHNGDMIHASEFVFRQELDRIRNTKSNVLLFCHGFNTDFKDALEIAYAIETTYEALEVVMFTWPSNGVTLDYLDDKEEAALSHQAFDRFLEKVREYNTSFCKKGCEVKFSLALHSMGNFLLETLVESPHFQGETHFLDNVILLSADVNNPGHEEWVSKLTFRNRLFVTINEDDFALNLSDSKFGREQKARLGNTARNLSASNAHYINFTDAALVRNAHNYFTRDEAIQNPTVKQFFQVAFSGGRAEAGLSFDAGSGSYLVS
ncbi:MAG: alpha/beta hydrolase [Cyanobacteria bacterium J06642_2]